MTMSVITETFEIRTTSKNEMINITSIIASFVQKHNVNSGTITIFIPHTTAAVTINENADPDVARDMLLGFNKVSPNRVEFDHYEGNSDAHIKSSLVGVDQTIIISNGKLLLGTWQGIFFCEFDGPRTRMVHVVIR